MSWLTNDEANAVAKDLGVDAKVVREMEGRMVGQDTAFDGYADDDSDVACQVPACYLEDRDSDPSSLLEDADWSDSSVFRLRNALDQLDERCRDILQKRWLAEEKATLHELADTYGVSAERIRQLEQNAIRKLRGFMGGDSYWVY